MAVFRFGILKEDVRFIWLDSWRRWCSHIWLVSFLHGTFFTRGDLQLRLHTLPLGNQFQGISACGSLVEEAQPFQLLCCHSQRHYIHQDDPLQDLSSMHRLLRCWISQPYAMASFTSMDSMSSLMILNAKSSKWPSEADWITHKLLIKKLYEKETLAKVMRIMEQEHGFKAT